MIKDKIKAIYNQIPEFALVCLIVFFLCVLVTFVLNWCISSAQNLFDEIPPAVKEKASNIKDEIIPPVQVNVPDEWKDKKIKANITLTKNDIHIINTNDYVWVNTIIKINDFIYKNTLNVKPQEEIFLNFNDFKQNEKNFNFDHNNINKINVSIMNENMKKEYVQIIEW